MIILRSKCFNRVSEFTEYWKLPVSDEIRKEFTQEEINGAYIKIEATEEYGRQFKEMKAAYGDQILKLKNSIKEGHLYDDGDVLCANTHFIAEVSKKGKHILFTKDIDSIEDCRGEHRLTYQIYPLEVVPIKQKDDSVIPTLIQRVVLQTCKGHKFHGKGLYSVIED